MLVIAACSGRWSASWARVLYTMPPVLLLSASVAGWVLTGLSSIALRSGHRGLKLPAYLLRGTALLGIVAIGWVHLRILGQVLVREFRETPGLPFQEPSSMWLAIQMGLGLVLGFSIACRMLPVSPMACSAFPGRSTLNVES
jgi:hypothetical protein